MKVLSLFGDLQRPRSENVSMQLSRVKHTLRPPTYLLYYEDTRVAIEDDEDKLDHLYNNETRHDPTLMEKKQRQ